MHTLLQVVVLLSTIGCATRSPAPPGSELVDELASITRAMCACPDAACADRVKARYDELERRGAERYGDVDALAPHVRVRAEQLDAEMRACFRARQPPVGGA